MNRAVLVSLLSLITMLLSTSCFVQIPRGSFTLPAGMAQQGYGFASRPSRAGQYDDRGSGQSRQEYSDVHVGTSQAEGFGRSPAFVDNSSLFPPSASSYDQTTAGLRAEGSSHSLLGSIHSQSSSVSPTMGQYSATLSHQQPHYHNHAQSSSHANQSSQPHQQSQHYPYQQHHNHHLHHPSEQQHQLGSLQMPGDLVGSQPLGMHHASAPFGFHPQSPRQPDFSSNLPDGQRKVPNRADTAEPHTPRPPNAWILYRSEKFREIQQSRNEQSRSGSSEKPKSQAEISRIVSQMWQNETSAVKQKFEALADEKKLAHQRMYPTYRYRPKKKGKGAKQSPANQSSDKSPGNSHSPTKEAYGSLAGGHHQDRYSPQGSCSSAYMLDRERGGEAHRSTTNHSPLSNHSQAGRDSMQRKANYGDRRDRGELQVPINYGRSVSGSTSSNESHSMSSYGNNRMHPYGDRAAAFIKQESPRQSTVFDDSPSDASSSYASSHWPGPDAMAAPSSGAYMDGSRAYPNFGGARVPQGSLMGPGSSGNPSLILSPISPPQRQLVPSQQLQTPINNMDGNNLNLAQFAGAPNYSNNGAGFRTAQMAAHGGRFGPAASFGDGSRSELPTGLAVPGSHEGLSDNFDPHRRI